MIDLYKLLIADDEQIVLDSIKFIVEKNFTDVVVAATARSGREAIEKTEIIKPDMVFMDIKMPGINGIDAIKEIKSRFNDVRFVILTAYEQFDFAKEAVNLGVVEYLLKPVNREKIVDIIRKMVTEIKWEREKRNRELELKERFESVLPVLESGFIYSILLFDDNTKELENYSAIFDIYETFGYIMTVEFGEAEGNGRLSNRIGLSVKSQSFYPYFRDVVKSRCKCLVGPVMLNRIVVFIPSNQDSGDYNQRVEAVAIAEYLVNMLTERADADFCIGIGRSYRGIENLSRSYEESLKALRYTANKGIMHIMDIPVDNKIAVQYPLTKEKLLLEKAAAGETGACLELFNFIFEWLVSEHGSSVQSVKEGLIELIVAIHRLAWDYGVSENDISKRQDYLGELLSIDGIAELKAWCRGRIEYLTASINLLREKRISSLILKARDYIDRNFKKEITLEEVSREVNVSPHYFCKLFKEETGVNFIDYLTSVRIEMAKNYLKLGELSVKEICFEVGYGDPNYFSRIFKKETGLTPTEYKENMQ